MNDPQDYGRSQISNNFQRSKNIIRYETKGINSHSQSNNSQHQHIDGSPEYIGPGMWYIIHKLASRAKTKKQKDLYVTMLYTICDIHECPQCRTNSLSYLSLNSPNKYMNIADGMFIHSWLFHNHENTRLDKPNIPYKVAHDFYYKDETECTGSCNLHDNNTDNVSNIEFLRRNGVVNITNLKRSNI